VIELAIKKMLVKQKTPLKLKGVYNVVYSKSEKCGGC
jgi:hypothetical protein